MSSTEESLIPSNFKTLLQDFTKDLTTVYPEYEHYWSKWGDPEITDEELKSLFDYCAKVYPERFFDILYQNDDIFKEDSDVNVYFLPKMSFRLLFNCEGVSDKSKKILWKYLQLMLFTVVGSVDDKKTFGETMNMFEGIDENILQDKLKEAMNNINDVFQSTNDEKSESTNDDDDADKEESTDTDGSTPNLADNMKNMFKNMGGLPNMENLQSHLKTLFDGKIGTLAKELAEEVADEFKNDLGGDLDDSKSAQDIIKTLMKNPNKIKNLMKTVSTRLDDKMKKGEISKDDIMKEAGDFLNQVKSAGGDAGVNDMLKNVMKTMGLGKNAKINKGALNRLMKQNETREKLVNKLAAKREKINKEKEAEKQKVFERIREQNKLKAQYSLNKGDNENLVFKFDDEADQEKSFIHPDLMKDIEEDLLKDSEPKSKKPKKKKKKKT
jgi:hypothetical protein